LVGAVMGRRAGGRPGRGARGDRAARLTGRAADTQALSPKAAAAKAARLGVAEGWTSLPIGRAVAGWGRWLVSGMEDVCLLIAGPRTGKTTCWVVPRIQRAAGAVVATSNKRDIVDITRDLRARVGQVFVFDPQGIADEPQAFWWDPLETVVDATSAEMLTRVLVDATRDATAQRNEFFDSASQNLLAALLLAAAKGGRPLAEIHKWISAPDNDEPLNLLRAAGETTMATTLDGLMTLVHETRSGVYGGAAVMVKFITNERAMAWITPHALLPQFHPADFVRGRGTLYCLSQEGEGSTAPIVTALTVAVVRAALDHAKAQPGGRLAAPMLIELDEAANVCRWADLPALYSHFGSRGILVDTIVQSWSQMITAWGEHGAKALWSAANVAAYGGGSRDEAFLKSLSQVIGTEWRDSVQVSHSRGQGRSRSVSTASQARPIASETDLASLPAGRAWVLASGCTPVLARMVPYWEQPDDLSAQALNRHQPTRR
ncbi:MULTISPECIES: type IV secretory system conjugative DNA transfer family protein, partial [Actinomyces]